MLNSNSGDCHFSHFEQKYGRKAALGQEFKHFKADRLFTCNEQYGTRGVGLWFEVRCHGVFSLKSSGSAGNWQRGQNQRHIMTNRRSTSTARGWGRRVGGES